MLNYYIKSDFLSYGKKYNTLNLIKEFILNKAFRYTFIMRIYKFYKDKNNHIIAICIKVFKLIIFLNTTIEIPLDLNVGKGLYMVHFSGITVNPNAVIGDNVNIHKGVTIGQENRGKRKGAPTIGNKVWIGINSTIVGNITIGDNVLICPNSFVNFDVPSNSIIIGNKIKSCNKATEAYINNVVQ